MPFLAQEPCVDHGGSSTDPSSSCCSGYTKWNYDANAGTPYTGFMCWTASCADQGQFANPGVGGPGCCPPLVNVGGKCMTAPSSTPPGTGIPPGGGGVSNCPSVFMYAAGDLGYFSGSSPSNYTNCKPPNDVTRCKTSQMQIGVMGQTVPVTKYDCSSSGSSNIFGGLDTTTMMMIGGGLLLLLMMSGGKKK